ncbi:MAG: hypothetical protein JST83_05780 [Bacteroidetes bacterium]|nr:hypothetical protein [Bacteroidota bacterium]
MNIEISNDKSVGDVQKEFRTAFPFLKIEFFKKNGAGLRNGMQTIPDKTTIGMIRATQALDSIDIDPARRVEEVEADFAKKLGLPVRIFRKSGNMWIETTLTDNWSLRRQNHEGEQMS